MSDLIAVHPVQNPYRPTLKPIIPQTVSMRAYEVYCEVYGPQEAMITGGCRGGFSVGEIIAFLYAHSFPKAEWSARVAQAFKGMELS